MAGVTIEAYSDAVDKLYVAAHQPESWVEAMEALRLLFDGSRACLLTIDPTAGFRAIPSREEDEAFDRSDVFQMVINDDLHHAWLDLPVGQPRRYGEMTNLDAFRQGDLARLFFRPRGMDNGLATVFKAGALTRWSFDISRSRRQSEFTQADVALARKLTPHILRAWEISNALGSIWADFEHACFVVDPRGKTLEMNSAAELLLTRPGSPLRQGGGVLRPAMADQAVRLGELIGSCCVPLQDSRSRPGGMMIAATSEDAPLESRLLLSVSPTPGSGWLALRRQRGALVLARPLQVGTQSAIAKMSTNLFGLSASQARLAAALASGSPLQDAARALGIGYGTARRYLEEIFRKTATRRQPELVALLKTMEATSIPVTRRGLDAHRHSTGK